MRDGLQLEVDGRVYTGFEDVSVTRTIEAAAGSFGARFRTKVPWPFLPGASVALSLDGEPVAQGFVDRVSPELSSGGRTFRMEGRDRTADLVDCAAVAGFSLHGAPIFSAEWYQTRLEQIVAELCRPYSIEVLPWGVQTEPFLRFALQPGESAWEAIERACRLRGILAFASADGNLILARPAQVRETETLDEAVNVLSASATIDHSERFAEYVVRGQSFGSDEVAVELAAAVEGRARDSAIRSQRRLLVLAEGSVADGSAQARAQWEATVRASRAAKLTVSVRGWQQRRTVKLWAPNQLVSVRLPSLGIEGDLLVTSASYSRSESGGTTTSLELLRPDAFQPQPDLKDSENPFEDLVEASS